MNAIPLPPTARDFEIHRLSLVEHISTRRIAEKHEISQTGVRQIVAHVSNWLAEHLPVKTEAKLEQEMRLAQCLAADQLQHQCEQLESLWFATNDPKYLRQKTRAILALARLGALPGAIDSLTADTVGWAAPTSPTSPIPNPKSQIQNSSPPPPRNCSPAADPSVTTDAPTAASPATSPLPAESSAYELSPDADHISGLKIMEQRLLTLITQTPPENVDRRQSLERTLATIRQELATVVLQISPRIVGAQFHESPHSPEPLAATHHNQTVNSYADA